ncbi:MAG TPA: polyribonucleotide nucleotidyltransferase [Patescibacteria group bacterium]|nr:polyribonucleotide nucleotidyltransferase [Patescibacteria group bacterium]
MKFTSKTFDFHGKQLTFETGKLAPQATSAVMGKMGDTVVLVTVVEGGKTELDYFPLSVDFIEHLYAGGKIKGSRWVKRDGRPSDKAVLSGRLIDRSIRPLFPKTFKNAVQIVVTVLSVDGENEADILALNTVSAALAISKIPWNGPIGAVRMGYDSEKKDHIYNPTVTEGKTSALDIVVSHNGDKTVMLEAGALQVEETVVHEAVVKAHDATKSVIKAIEELVKEVGQEKLEVAPEANLTEAKELFEKSHKAEIADLLKSRVEKDSDGGLAEELIAKVFEEIKTANPESTIDKKVVAAALDAVMYKLIRSDILEKQKRPDGRKMDQVRDLSIEAGVLPRTHGSALFQRGMTQAMSIVTLGSPRMGQLIESAEGEEEKRYIHHYSGLPSSFGQVGRIGTPGRREIGHGALAERALQAVIPSQEEFPYTIMVVSEVLSQNGSSSMASTCGSTLALMDAGVPIKKPVAGISVGMMSSPEENGKYELLTDIIGLEDFSGDMDFKVAGTDTGITAIQLDVKIPGLTDEQVGKILERAKSARLFILEKMLAVLPGPRAALSVYAPKIVTVKIPVEKIGELIGPSGKNIKNIIATTGAQVDVEDDGTVSITGVEEANVQAAYEWISGMTREVKVGEVFENAEVKRILPFGAFVEFLPGKEGMVHVSKMADHFVQSPTEVVNIGDKVTVKVVEVDDQGRYNLTMRLDDNGSSEGGDTRERKEGRGRDFGGGHRGGPRPFNPQQGAPTTTPTKHPLAMQFEREKRQNRSGFRGQKRDYSR